MTEQLEARKRALSEPIRVKGNHFTTEPLPSGDVRICWSETEADPAKWDALDFWIVPADKVDDAIAQVREGFEL